MTAFYNECDPFAAQWLRNLISAGHIAPGIVDERPIQEIEAFELSGFTQCHFFAGIGVWSHALRRAGWADDRPIWTGSCPCQPFSNAGTRKGISDERHLWPYWHPLIEQRKPPIVVGEQVASKDGLGWLDLVSTDMEASDYAFGASDLCAAGFDGAHIRQRLYFLGLADDDDDARLERHGQPRQFNATERRENAPRHDSAVGALGGLVDDDDGTGSQPRGSRPSTARHGNSDEPTGSVGGLADKPANGRRKERADTRRITSGNGAQGVAAGFSGSSSDNRTDAPMLGRNAADWLYCRDEKWRPVEPGTFPLVDAAPARVGRLRAYGNALDAETATEFCRTVKEICDGV